jgi:ANTAR domain
MARHGTDAGEAFPLLKTHSQRTGKKLIKIAEAITETHQLLPNTNKPRRTFPLSPPQPAETPPRRSAWCRKDTVPRPDRPSSGALRARDSRGAASSAAALGAVYLLDLPRVSFVSELAGRLARPTRRPRWRLSPGGHPSARPRRAVAFHPLRMVTPTRPERRLLAVAARACRGTNALTDIPP